MSSYRRHARWPIDLHGVAPARSRGESSGNVGRVQPGLGGAGVVFRYRDDEPGSPWTFVLYLDERADSRQRRLLEEVSPGDERGTALHQFPWARDGSTLVAVRPARIDFDHSAREAGVFIDSRPYGSWDRWRPMCGSDVRHPRPPPAGHRAGRR